MKRQAGRPSQAPVVHGPLGKEETERQAAASAGRPAPVAEPAPAPPDPAGQLLSAAAEPGTFALFRERCLQTAVETADQLLSAAAAGSGGVPAGCQVVSMSSGEEAADAACHAIHQLAAAAGPESPTEPTSAPEQEISTNGENGIAPERASPSRQGRRKRKRSERGSSRCFLTSYLLTSSGRSMPTAPDIHEDGLALAKALRRHWSRAGDPLGTAMAVTEEALQILSTWRAPTRR
jgi:hypothetical protein